MKKTIKEIKEQLQEITDLNNPFIHTCQADERKGVQAALKSWFKEREAESLLEERFVEMNQFEQKAGQLGYRFIAGLDEVGRGPLAGPVVSAAVILDPAKPILGLNDSKKLSLKKRNELFLEIQNKAISVGIGVVTAEEIDRYNILEASKMSMKQAIEKLATPADFLLVDAVKLNTGLPEEILVKGDMRSNSIAAASIIAKVTRDEMMVEYDDLYPGYGFVKNAGYGTKEHLDALGKLGVTPIHRVSFAPVKNNLK